MIDESGNELVWWLSIQCILSKSIRSFKSSNICLFKSLLYGIERGNDEIEWSTTDD